MYYFTEHRVYYIFILGDGGLCICDSTSIQKVRKEFSSERAWDDALLDITSQAFLTVKTEVELELNSIYQEIPYYAGVWVLRAFQSSASAADPSGSSRKKRSATTAFETEIWINNDTLAGVDKYEFGDNKTTLQDLGFTQENSTVSECVVDARAKLRLTPPPYLTMLGESDPVSVPVGLPIYYECKAFNEILDSSAAYVDPDGDLKFTVMCGPDGTFDLPEWPTRDNCIAPNLCLTAPLPPVESKLAYPVGTSEGTDDNGDPALKTKVKENDILYYTCADPSGVLSDGRGKAVELKCPVYVPPTTAPPPTTVAVTTPSAQGK